MHDRDEIRIDKIELTTAGPDSVESGLLGFIRCRLNGRLQLDGIALRRTRDRRYTLSFPARTDANGERRFIVRPLDDETRLEIERQVLQALAIAA